MRKMQSTATTQALFLRIGEGDAASVKMFDSRTGQALTATGSGTLDIVTPPGVVPPAPKK
jgi:hypothetical protein